MNRREKLRRIRKITNDHSLSYNKARAKSKEQGIGFIRKQTYYRLRKYYRAEEPTAKAEISRGMDVKYAKEYAQEQVHRRLTKPKKPRKERRREPNYRHVIVLRTYSGDSWRNKSGELEYRVYVVTGRELKRDEAQKVLRKAFSRVFQAYPVKQPDSEWWGGFDQIVRNGNFEVLRRNFDMNTPTSAARGVLGELYKYDARGKEVGYYVAYRSRNIT